MAPAWNIPPPNEWADNAVANVKHAAAALKPPFQGNIAKAALQSDIQDAKTEIKTLQETSMSCSKKVEDQEERMLKFFGQLRNIEVEQDKGKTSVDSLHLLSKECFEELKGSLHRLQWSFKESQESRNAQAEEALHEKIRTLSVEIKM